MSCYISSNENRLYTAQESAYGQVAAITAANRIAAIKLSTKQELVERSVDVKSPTLLLYCEKISNDLREKFRTFSGKAFMAIEVRVSQDRIEGLGRSLEIYVDTVTRILDQNRGDWGNGMFYTGGYEAVFGEMKHGGRNFIQTAKVRFEVAVSID